jgi:hypothetical protein
MKKFKYSILTKLSNLFLIGFLCMIGVFIFYKAELSTFIWHKKNPTPILWNNLRISVPESLVAKKMLDLDKVLIYPYSSTNPGIIIERTNLSAFNSLIKFFKTAGYKVNDIPCEIASKSCIWIKATNKKNKIAYTEEIFLIDNQVKISFKGSEDKRIYFLELIENLEFTKELKKMGQTSS